MDPYSLDKHFAYIELQMIIFGNKVVIILLLVYIVWISTFCGEL
jgi:hypothetical protein